MVEKRQHLIPLIIADRRNLEVSFDAAGYINHARQPNPFLIDELLVRDIIDDQGHFYGVQMIAMRDLFMSPVAAKTKMLRTTDDEGQPNPQAIPMQDTDYLRVLRKLLIPKHREIVQVVCWQDADHRHLPELERMEATVHMAFRNLADAIIELWEEKNACASNGSVPR